MPRIGDDSGERAWRYVESPEYVKGTGPAYGQTYEREETVLPARDDDAGGQRDAYESDPYADYGDYDYDYDVE